MNNYLYIFIKMYLVLINKTNTYRHKLNFFKSFFFVYLPFISYTILL